MTDLKHRIRNWVNDFGIDIIPVNRSPISVVRSLGNMEIRTVIDIGANEGQYARRALRHFPRAIIHSFEPLPEQYSVLRKWALPKKDNVKTYNVALGERNGDFSINHHIDHSPSSSFLKITREERQNEVRVKMTTLDNAVDVYGIDLSPNVLVKMDVQGYEDRVVEGGRNTLSMAHACIMEIGLMEIYENQADFIDLVNKMKENGMRFAGVADQIHDKQGNAKYIDALFLRDTVSE